MNQTQQPSCLVNNILFCYEEETHTGNEYQRKHTSTQLKTVMREIQKRKDMRWVIRTDLLNSMLAIENNREKNPILNQIYDIY